VGLVVSSDFSLDLDDLNNSQSITQRIGETFYPNGVEVYKNTTQSVDDTSGRSLTSADPVKILQGDGIYRNPGFAINGYIQNVQSSLHGIIAMAGDIDDSIKIPDPNADPNDPEKKFLSGADARQHILKDSFLLTGYAPGGFATTMQDLIASKTGTDMITAEGSAANNSTTATVTTDQRN